MRQGRSIKRHAGNGGRGRPISSLVFRHKCLRRRWVRRGIHCPLKHALMRHVSGNTRPGCRAQKLHPRRGDIIIGQEIRQLRQGVFIRLANKQRIETWRRNLLQLQLPRLRPACRGTQILRLLDLVHDTLATIRKIGHLVHRLVHTIEPRLIKRNLRRRLAQSLCLGGNGVAQMMPEIIIRQQSSKLRAPSIRGHLQHPLHLLRGRNAKRPNPRLRNGAIIGKRQHVHPRCLCDRRHSLGFTRGQRANDNAIPRRDARLRGCRGAGRCAL